jgi:hypothetical protein
MAKISDLQGRAIDVRAVALTASRPARRCHPDDLNVTRAGSGTRRTGDAVKATALSGAPRRVFGASD